MTLKYHTFELLKGRSLSHLQSLIARALLQIKSTNVIRFVLSDRSAEQRLLRVITKSSLPANEAQSHISQVLQDNGITVRPQADVYESMAHTHTTACCDHGHSANRWHDRHEFKAVIGLGYGLVTAGLIGFGVGLSATALMWLHGVTAAMSIYLGVQTYQNAWRSLRAGQLKMSTLYTISTLTLLLCSLGSLFIPGLPLMLESAPLILGFWHLGEAIEHHLLKKINHQLDIRDWLPKQIKKIGTLGMTPISHLLPGDVIEVPPGTFLPVDGELFSALGQLDTTMVNGSAYPKQFHRGDAVTSGMRVTQGTAPVQVKVSHIFDKSYLSRVAYKVTDTLQQKAPLEQYANAILQRFVPALLLTATVSAMILPFFYPVSKAFNCVISILVSACPCALSLITPLAIRTGMRNASAQGVHFKHGKALQEAAGIDAVVFDLNGTLTKGQPVVSQILGITDADTLKDIATLEAQSKHPVANQIVQYLANKGVSAGAASTIAELDKTRHCGIKGTIGGHTYLIGNLNFLSSHDISLDGPPSDASQTSNTYVVRDGSVIGRIQLQRDPLRPHAQTIINQLKQLGMTIYICTGADRPTARHYAQQLGIDKSHVYANAAGIASDTDGLSKEQVIRVLKDKGLRVAMIGDAANDLTAMASADLAIAVESEIGDQLTENSAGAVIHKGGLRALAAIFDFARHTKANILQNLTISLGYNLSITAVASGLFLSLGLSTTPVMGGLLIILESLIVFTNLLRLKHYESPFSVVRVSTREPEPKPACCHDAPSNKPAEGSQPTAAFTAAYEWFTGAPPCSEEPKAQCTEQSHSSHQPHHCCGH